jgi:hypothetical protein
MSIQLSENDRAELEKFRLYLRAVGRWDNEHDDLPDFAPITDDERMAYGLKRLKAHQEIYKQIYGDSP